MVRLGRLADNFDRRLCDDPNLATTGSKESMNKMSIKHFFVLSLSIIGSSSFALCEGSPFRLPVTRAHEAGMDEHRLAEIDSVVQRGIERGEMPGCVVLVAHASK